MRIGMVLALVACGGGSTMTTGAETATCAVDARGTYADSEAARFAGIPAGAIVSVMRCEDDGSSCWPIDDWSQAARGTVTVDCSGSTGGAASIEVRWIDSTP